MGTTARHVKGALKTLLYYGVDSLAYKAHALLPVVDEQALFVEMKRPEPSTDIALVMQELASRGFVCDFISLGKGNGLGFGYILRCAHMSWKAARAHLLFLSDSNMPVGCLPVRPQTAVVQLWHACGAFKKFGYSTAEKIFGPDRVEAERFPHYGNTSLVTVSSPEVVWAYEEAMGLKGTGAVQPLGVSRTDVFFDEERLKSWRAQAQEAVPAIDGRRVLLYAPTFRGEVTSPEAPDFLDLERLRQRLKDGWVVLIKHHPLVRDRPAIPASCEGWAFDVSDALAIEACMVAADVCVTDYSSLIYEYALLERPMAFLAPDRDDYDDWRGFYYDYDELTPGPVFATTEELADWVCSLPNTYDPAVVEAFRDKFMSACDGGATKRIVDAALALVPAKRAKGDSPLCPAFCVGGEPSHVG